MIGVNPRVDMFIVGLLLLIVFAVMYPFWVRTWKRFIRWWRDELDKANDDIVESEYDKRFKRKGDR